MTEKSKFDLGGRPLHERVLVILDKYGETTKGGIYLPEEAREIANTATVYAVGPLANNESEDIKPGDRVIIQRMGGMPLVINGVTYQLLMKHDILFVMDRIDEDETK